MSITYKYKLLVIIIKVFIMDCLLSDGNFLLCSLGFLLTAYFYLNPPTTRRWWVRPLYAERAEKGAFVNIYQHLKNEDHEMFFKYTRMYPDQFDKLLGMVKHKLLKKSRREFLTPELRLVMTIKYLAHGGSFQNIAWEFRTGLSTISKVILETCEAIWEIMQPRYLKVPETVEEWHNISQHFWELWNFPHTLGAIDGKHVEIQCPANSGSLYFNYKNYFSIVLLACCDAKYKFIWVDLGAEGSENDSGVFRRSQIGKDLDDGKVILPPEDNLPGCNQKMGYFFVGDEAFPLKSYIMRPYPGKYLGQQKNIFNYRLSRARRVIENSFGILASRWRVYRAPLLCSLKTCKAIVKATICLHNFLQSENNSYISQNLIDRELDNGDIIAGQWREITKGDSNLRSVGRVGANIAPRIVYKMRDELSEYLGSDAGSVPWQLNVVNRGININ